MNIPGLDQEIALETNLPKRKNGGLSLSTLVLLAGLLAMVIVVGAQLARRTQTQPYAGAAPDFTLTLYGSGDEFTLSEQKGKIVVVNFWGSWCPPCRDEAPDFQAIHEQYADQGVVLVGVNYRDVESRALSFIDEYGITYLNGLDVGERITTRYNIAAAPETFIIDRNGEIFEFYLGPVNYAELAGTLDRALAQEIAE